MKCIEGIHYEVVRKQVRYRGKYHEGDIHHLACKFCTHHILKRQTPMPRGGKSGLARYNRMRGNMVRHLHEWHKEELADGKTGQ